MRRAVQTKIPDIVWAVEVMRKNGCSCMTTGASGTQEVLEPCVAAVAGGRGAKPTGESFPNLCDKGISRRQS